MYQLFVIHYPRHALVYEAIVASIVGHPYFPAYRKNIWPLLPTLATANCLPSLPAELPSEAISALPSSASFLARRLILFSWRKPKPSCNCFFLVKSGGGFPAVFERGAGQSVIPFPFLGDASTSRTSLVLGVVFATNRPRGDRRSRCRCRSASGVRAWAGSEA